MRRRRTTAHETRSHDAFRLYQANFRGVQVVLPGTQCLVCAENINLDRAAKELKAHAWQEYDRAHGYGTDETAPSVISLNGVIGSLQVTEVLSILAGQILGQRKPPLRIYDALRGDMLSVPLQSSEDCGICGKESLTAYGDLAPLMFADYLPVPRFCPLCNMEMERRMPIPINKQWQKRQRALKRKKAIHQAIEKSASILTSPRLRLTALILIAGLVLSFVIGLALLHTSKQVVPSGLVNGDATASVVAANPYPSYFHHGQGTLAIYDPLHQSSGSLFQTSANCRFVRQTYHISTPSGSNLAVCFGPRTKFRNFAFEVEMTILRGDCGGLLFRKNSSTQNKYYLFYVCQNRGYDLLKYVDSTNAHAQSLPTPSKTNSAIIAGLGKTNKIAVVAQGNTIYLYINSGQIAEVHDKSYTEGYLALVAFSKWGNNPTEVAYRNLKVWTP